MRAALKCDVEAGKLRIPRDARGNTSAAQKETTENTRSISKAVPDDFPQRQRQILGILFDNYIENPSLPKVYGIRDFKLVDEVKRGEGSGKDRDNRKPFQQMASNLRAVLCCYGHLNFGDIYALRLEEPTSDHLRLIIATSSFAPEADDVELFWPLSKERQYLEVVCSSPIFVRHKQTGALIRDTKTDLGADQIERIVELSAGVDESARRKIGKPQILKKDLAEGPSFVAAPLFEAYVRIAEYLSSVGYGSRASRVHDKATYHSLPEVTNYHRLFLLSPAVNTTLLQQLLQDRPIRTSQDGDYRPCSFVYRRMPSTWSLIYGDVPSAPFEDDTDAKMLFPEHHLPLRTQSEHLVKYVVVSRSSTKDCTVVAGNGVAVDHVMKCLLDGSELDRLLPVEIRTKSDFQTLIRVLADQDLTEKGAAPRKMTVMNSESILHVVRK
ncbi:hypothetical protein [Bryocella elongata]|uniref:hypothetical protein n=1 Tax=Bryocella elongata TaxID=863522 RepID=UPI0011B06DE3|nr:hypothetical protein [Bryocella elongata]